MKRTVTAAATTLLAGSAGAFGLAGTAAADTTNLAAELGLEEQVKDVAFQVASGARSAAITAHSAKTVVGDVVPMQGAVPMGALPNSVGRTVGHGTANPLSAMPTTTPARATDGLTDATSTDAAGQLATGKITDAVGGLPGGRATGALGNLPGGQLTQALGGDLRTGAVDETLDLVDSGASFGTVTGELNSLTEQNSTPLSSLPL